MTAVQFAPTVVRSFGFNIPCRRFLIRANVTRDRRLPVVDEFVLRAVKLCGDVPVNRLARYFGFSPAETERVMSDLVGRGLVNAEGNNVSLHPSAHEYFRGSEDGAPRIVEVDAWIERLWFDLVSKNMVAPDRTRVMRNNLIDIRPADMARDLPAAYAKRAFEDNFAEYLRKIRRIKNPDRFSLYSVSESIAERFGSIVFRMNEELTFDPDPHLRPNILAFDSEQLLRFGKLTTAVLDSYRGLTWIGPSAAALAEFSGLSGERSITEAHSTATRFDLDKWLLLNPNNSTPNRQTIFGSSYIKRNIDFIVHLIDNMPAPPPQPHIRKDIEILWYRPGGSGWGRSPELQESLQSLKLALRRKLGKVQFRTRLITPYVARRDHPERFRSIFDEGWLAPAGLISPGIEVVYIPGIATVMLVTVSLSSSVDLPVGFASTAAEPLQRVARKLVEVDAKFEELWKGERHDEDDVPLAPPELDEVADEQDD
jgi:hypothetical protein